MSPEARAAILAMGLVFCAVFAYMTIAVAMESTFDILTLISLGIIVMIAIGLIGAIRNPPKD